MKRKTILQIVAIALVLIPLGAYKGLGGGGEESDPAKLAAEVCKVPVDQISYRGPEQTSNWGPGGGSTYGEDHGVRVYDTEDGRTVRMVAEDNGWYARGAIGNKCKHEVTAAEVIGRNR